MATDKIMDGISEEIFSTLKAFEKSKTSEDKINNSLILKNLCEALGVFLNLMHDSEVIEGYDHEEDSVNSDWISQEANQN